MMKNANRQRKRHSHILSQTLPLSADDTLILKCEGPIAIKGVDGSDITIKGKGDLSWSREGQQVTVHVSGPISVKIPRTVAHMQLHLDGPIDLKEITEGVIEVLSADGPLTIQKGASVHVHAADGPLTLSDIREQVQVDVADGPISLKNIGGDITIVRQDGPTTIKNCRGDMDVTTDDVIFVQLSGELAQKVRGRSGKTVIVKLPAATAVAGTIAADGPIDIDLEQLTVEGAEETLSLTPPAGATPVITLDIEAGDAVYVGPNPPDLFQTMGGSGLHHMGMGWLGAFFGRRRGPVPRTVVTPSPPSPVTPAPEPDLTDEDIAEAQAMVLRMVAAGKITAEEGNDLLEALK